MVIERTCTLLSVDDLPAVLNLGISVLDMSRKRMKFVIYPDYEHISGARLPTTRPIFIPDEQRIAATPPLVEGTTGTSRICEQKSGCTSGEGFRFGRACSLL